MLCFVLQKILTHVKQVVRRGPAFCSCSTRSFSKRNGSQGHLIKGQIFSADLLIKMIDPFCVTALPVKGVFKLPCIEDLLLEGPGQRQVCKARPSVFSDCPRFKMLPLGVVFR